MTNAYYNSSMVATPLAVIRSQTVLAQFTLVADGFTAVETAMGLKAPAASPTFTGTANFSSATLTLTSATVNGASATLVTVPTAAVGEANTSKAVNVASLLAHIGASGTMLPPQTTHAGKVLQTNGVSASWEQRLPSQTSNSGKFLGTDGSGEAWRYALPLSGGGIAVITSSASITGTERLIDLTGASQGAAATLPDARTLGVGDSFLLGYGSSAAVNFCGVRDNVGELLHDSASTGVALVLSSNATQAGTWKRLSIASNLSSLASLGLTALNMPSSTIRTNCASVAFAVPLGSDKFLIAMGRSSSGGIDLFVATVVPTTGAISIGAVVNVATADALYWGSLVAVTGGYALIYAANTALKVLGITVSGDTVTAGSITTLVASISRVTAQRELSVAVDGAVIVATYRATSTSLEVIACSFSGTTATPGGASAVLSTSSMAGTAFAKIVPLSAGLLLVAYSTDDGAGTETSKARTVTLIGTSVTPNVAVDCANSAVKAMSGDMVVIDSTKALLAWVESTGTGYARVLSVSGTTVTANAAQSLGGLGLSWSTGSSTLRATLAHGNGGYAFALYDFGSSGTQLLGLTVSGTTVSTLTAYSIGIPTQLDWKIMRVGTKVAIPRPATSQLGVLMLDLTGSGYANAITAGTLGFTVKMPAYNTDPLIFKLTGKHVLMMGAAGTLQGMVFEYGGVAE